MMMMMIYIYIYIYIYIKDLALKNLPYIYIYIYSIVSFFKNNSEEVLLIFFRVFWKFQKCVNGIEINL